LYVDIDVLCTKVPSAVKEMYNNSTQSQTTQHAAESVSADVVINNTCSHKATFPAAEADNGSACDTMMKNTANSEATLPAAEAGTGAACDTLQRNTTDTEAENPAAEAGKVPTSDANSVLHSQKQVCMCVSVLV